MASVTRPKFADITRSSTAGELRAEISKRLANNFGATKRAEIFQKMSDEMAVVVGVVSAVQHATVHADTEELATAIGRLDVLLRETVDRADNLHSALMEMQSIMDWQEARS